MSYDYEFEGNITIDEQALGDRLAECLRDFSAIWNGVGYCDGFNVSQGGNYRVFRNIAEFVRLWGEFIEDINIEARGESMGDHMLFSLRDGQVVATSGRVVYDQEETVLQGSLFPF